MPAYVAGVDSSTQTAKVVVVDPATDRWCARPGRPIPRGPRSTPRHWWAALSAALGEGRHRRRRGDLDRRPAARDGALRRRGEPVRDALLWNDTRSAHAAHDLIAEFGGAGAWADARGTSRSRAHGTKLRWLRDAEPENAERVAAVALPHDWLTWRLRGRRRRRAGPLEAHHRPGRRLRHRLLVPGAGALPPRPARARLRPGTRRPAGRRAREDVGRGHERRRRASRRARRRGQHGRGPRRRGRPRVTWSSRSGPPARCSPSADAPTADPSGLVAGFADATGRFLPLVVHAQRRPRARGGRGPARRGRPTGSTTSRSRPPPARAGWCWCPTSRASAPPTGPTPPGRSAG